MYGMGIGTYIGHGAGDPTILQHMFDLGAGLCVLGLDVPSVCPMKASKDHIVH